MNLSRVFLAVTLCVGVVPIGCDKMKSLVGAGPAATDAGSVSYDKLTKYAKAQNDLAELHPFKQEIAEYAEYNPEIAGRGPLATYSAVTNPFDSAIYILKDAMAVKADLGALDAAAARVLGAIQALNPTVKAMRAYADSEQVAADRGGKARELDPVYRAQMSEASAADAEFERLLSARSTEMAAARMQALKPETLEYQVLNTNLQTRRAVDALAALTADGTAETQAAFAATLDPMAKANAELGGALAAYHGGANMDHCKAFQTLTAKLVGESKDVAADPKVKVHGGTREEKFVNDYNLTLAPLASCTNDLQP